MMPVERTKQKQSRAPGEQWRVWPIFMYIGMFYFSINFLLPHCWNTKTYLCLWYLLYFNILIFSYHVICFPTFNPYISPSEILSFFYHCKLKTLHLELIWILLFSSQLNHEHYMFFCLWKFSAIYYCFIYL